MNLFKKLTLSFSLFVLLTGFAFLSQKSANADAACVDNLANSNVNKVCIVKGKVFIDPNSTGDPSGKSPKNGITVRIWRGPSGSTYQNGTQKENEEITGQANTPGPGQYKYFHEPVGDNYHIQAVLPSGWTCTTNNCDNTSFSFDKNHETRTINFGVKQATSGGNCTETTPTIHITSANGSQSTPQGGTATYPLTVSNTNNPAKCPNGGNYNLSITAANGLPTGIAIDPTTTSISGVSQGNPKQIDLKINTAANTPTRNANHAYALILHAKNTTNNAKKTTSGITLAVTAGGTNNSCTVATEATDCPTGKYCAADNTCQSGCRTSPNSCPTGQTCNSETHTCQAADDANDCRIPGALCTNPQVCNEDTGICQTPTGATTLSFTVGLDNIGTTGDNQSRSDPDNPSAYHTPVVAPAHPTKPIRVDLFKGIDDETPVYTVNDTIDYSPVIGDANSKTIPSPQGKFTGTVNLPDNFVPGNYIVKITVPGHLTRQIPGIQDIKAGVNPMTAVNVVAGDINGDNQLGLADFYILIGCSILNHSASNVADCNSNENFKLLSDLNDDGTATTPKVDNSDYNFFLREYGVQNGD